eukprot:CAMPEP_0197839428 /NCGR_PEP_ID=MMETSP1437-20131217/42823_1 /TAXON_ID=49252 ORGANISM="Eucampia antarctica, Strain CCMP1452" /NCGR_SAMPLE_ID=MMETSP1437 /ASSEMBLY_ACC=CAM_ASM_001096 /LENGTH=211 /DNA_ID=CAMNT_0043448487 /DNA_START=59 /DNA_END=691 /DNA_ORIENTATION=-
MSLLGSVRVMISSPASALVFNDDSAADLDKESKESDEMTSTPQQEGPAPPSTFWLFQDQDQSQKQQLLAYNTRNTKEWIDQWTAAGLSNYVSLPMICVLGDTSSGKSSVLSSLIGLELPSASTLTTKCPVLVQLKRLDSPSQTAKVTVTIQWHRSGPRSRKCNIESQVQAPQAKDTMARIEKQVIEINLTKQDETSSLAYVANSYHSANAE